MLKAKDIDKPRQLVVEGRDAEEFFKALLRDMGLAEIQVQNFGGKDELPRFLDALKRMSGFIKQVISMGVVRDADNNPGDAFQSACGALSRAGLAVPNKAEEFKGNSPKVSVLILPNAEESGMLETLCLQSVKNDPVMQCIDEYFDCISQKLMDLPNNMYKAKAQAFLASRARPGLLLGQAANAGYWPWDHPVFDHVKRFLRTL